MDRIKTLLFVSLFHITRLVGLDARAEALRRRERSGAFLITDGAHGDGDEKRFTTKNAKESQKGPSREGREGAKKSKVRATDTR